LLKVVGRALRGVFPRYINRLYGLDYDDGEGVASPDRV